jgi:hypothetical protein
MALIPLVIKIEIKTRNERHRFLRGNPYGKNHGRTKAYFHYDGGVLQARDDRSYLVRLLGYIYEGNIQESLEDKKTRYTCMRRLAYIKPINRIWITLQQPPFLPCQISRFNLWLKLNACDVGIGVFLSQKGHSLAFVCRALGPRNKGLSVYEKEYLAILHAVQQWWPYLQLAEFVIHIDHKSLVHLTDQRLHTVWH